jgi:hypothetical protein
MTTAKDLYAALEETPNDWTTRSILADWYLDAGEDSIAQCLQWMVKHHKRPHHATSGLWHWFDIDRSTTALDPESDIPSEIYRHLQGTEGLQHCYRDYETLEEAEHDFYRAWAEIHIQR